MHCPLFLTLALPALTKPSSGYVGVCGIVGVTLRAMRLASVRRGGAVGVLASTDRFQVVRIDATPNAAEMVNLETIGNRAHPSLIGEAMPGDSLILFRLPSLIETAEVRFPGWP